MPTQQISGTIYQMYDASGNNRRFPVTVVDGVLGLRSYMEEQFSSLASLYMGINDVALSGTVLTVKGVPVNLATVTDLSNYYTKTEADGRYLQLTGGSINAPSVNPLSLNNTTVSNNVYLTLKIQNSTKAELGYSAGYGAYLQNGVSPNHTVWLLDTGVLKFNDNTIWHSGNDGAGSGLDADLLDGQHASAIIDTASTNPKSELKTGQEFVFRKTNVEWDAKSGVIKKIKGKTLAWNQLVPDNRIEGNGTDNPYLSICSAISSSVHKYYARVKCSGSNVTRAYLVGEDAGGVYTEISLTKRGDIYSDIVAIGGYYGEIYFRIGTTTYVSWEGAQLIDLTLMFGAGNEPSTVAEFEALYLNPIAFNPGTLISNDAEAVETTGVNQWDEEAVEGYYNPSNNGAFVSGGGSICSKNLFPALPSTIYYIKSVGVNARILYFDKSRNYLGTDYPINNGTFTTPSGCALLAFNMDGAYGTTYNHDICINISNSAINGQYFPYKKSRINLGLKNIKVVSPNVWDEEVSFSGNDLSTANYIPCLPSYKYYLKAPNNNFTFYFYDANKVQIAEVFSIAYNAEFTTPTNANYMKFIDNYGASTYNHDITINLSNPAFNGSYFPYGTLNLEGGVKGAGSAYDYIENGKYHKRANRVLLTSFEWSQADTHFYSASASSLMAKPYGSNDVVIPGVCSKYLNSAWSSRGDMSIAIDGNSAQVISVNDSSCSTLAEFIDAIQGVKLDYELQYEEVYDLADPLPSVYPCDQFGTERVISPVSVTPSAPFCADIQYGAKSDDVANDLIGTRDAVQPLLDALQYDGQNHAWHLKGNLYADGLITAYGINGGAQTAVIAPYLIESSNYSTSKIWVGLNVMNEAIAKYKRGYLVQAKKAGEYITYSVTSIDESNYILYCNGGSVTVELES